MDSKIVNREIRRVVRPLLKEAGFTRFTTRNSWRYTDSRVEVVNFQSFNSYLAESIGCTTYSFSVNLGSFLLELPPVCRPGPIKEKDGQFLPHEYQCQFRGRLRRSFAQPELDRRDTWYIDPGGNYLEEALLDVRERVFRDAFPWFESLRDTGRVLQILLREPEDTDRLWGFGRDPSPIRSLLTGYTALALGRKEVAGEQLRAALRSGCFESFADQITKDIEASGPPAD